MTGQEVRERLLAMADPGYKEFNDKIANCQTLPSIGVRVPDIRNLAKEILKGDWKQFLEEMEHPISYQEEHMLQGIVTGGAKLTKEERCFWLNRWIPGVISWGDCDCSISSFKFMKKDQEFWFAYICRWLASKREFEVRVALVALMQYFINDTYIDRVLEIFAKDYRTHFEEENDVPAENSFLEGASGGKESESPVPYYVRMAQAWALSVCFVKYRDKTWEVFERKSMEPWVQNKGIQKCRESYRVSKEDKERLKTLKRTV